MEEDAISFTPLSILANSVDPTKSRSSSYHILRLAKIGSLVGVDESTTNSPASAYGGLLASDRGIRGAKVGVGYRMVAAGIVLVGGTEGVGLYLAEKPGGKGTEMTGRGMGDLPQSSIAGGEVCMSARSTGGFDMILEDVGTRTGEAHE